MDVRLPDGTVIQNVPDGTTKADLVAKLKANGMAVPSEWLAAAPPPPPEPSLASRVGRQIGLTARHGLEGAAQAASTLTEPIRAMVVNPIARMAQPTGQQPTTAAPITKSASDLADWLGLPSPQTPLERVVGDASRTVASAGSMAGAAKSAAGAVTGTTRNVLEQLAARPGMQLAGAAGAGAAGGAVREAGGGPLAQFGASMAGGVAGGLAADKIPGTVNAIRGLLPISQSMLTQADQQINLTLQRSGIDWSQVPERVKQGMRSDVAQALNTGQELNPDAIRRLYVFRATGTTPTVGMLTQNPGQITMEQNLAKAGANSSDKSLHGLHNVQNENAAALLQRLDESGAAGAPDAFEAGQRTIGALDANAQRAKGNINSLYSAARDTQGRSLPLEPGTFTRRANEMLDEAMVGGALPGDVAKTMNKIATGDMPLTVEIAEQLKTRIGNLQRATSDGSARMALKLVRQALDETPLQGSPKVNPGNLPAVPGTVPPSATVTGQESIDAFNQARTAHREWMKRVEASPALQAVVDGIEPDQFVQKFIIGKGATAADVRRLRDELGSVGNPQNLPAVAGEQAGSSPQAVEAIRQYLVRHLRNAATNYTGDITKFSNDAYRGALRDIGDQKLAVFFTPEEIQHLKNIGDAAKYMQAQPAGSAVNNSNSGALLIGKGLDMLSGVTGKLPLGLKDTINGTVQGWQQRQVLAPRNALAAAAAQGERPPLLNPLLAAALASPAQAGQQDRGR